MDELSIPVDELSHVIRLGAMGETKQFLVAARRVARRIKRVDATLGDSLLSDLAVSSTDDASAPFRRATPVSAVEPALRPELLIEARTLHSVKPSLPASAEDLVNTIILEQQQRPKLELAGLTPIRAAIFSGPPGVGKTMTAYWIAKQLGRPLYVLDISAVSSSLFGKTGANLKDALAYAKAQDSVLLLDEFDAIAKGRDHEDIGEAKRIVTVLLQEMDGWPSHSLLIAATNHPELLDRAIWRRFDVRLEFDNADADTALSAALTALGADVDAKIAEIIATTMVGRPLSDIAAVAQKARKRALLKNEKIEDALLSTLTALELGSSRTAAQKLALQLIDLGYSQRRVSELTGISRDTLRKRIKGGHDEEAN